MIYLQEEINYIPLYKSKQETVFSLWDNMDLSGAAVTFNYPNNPTTESSSLSTYVFQNLF